MARPNEQINFGVCLYACVPTLQHHTSSGLSLSALMIFEDCSKVSPCFLSPQSDKFYFLMMCEEGLMLGFILKGQSTKCLTLYLGLRH